MFIFYEFRPFLYR